MTMIVTVSKAPPWYIVLYEWQACQKLSTDTTWYPSAEICHDEETARSRKIYHQTRQTPMRGQLTYRNVRGPFKWSEPTI